MGWARLWVWFRLGFGLGFGFWLGSCQDWVALRVWFGFGLGFELMLMYWFETMLGSQSKCEFKFRTGVQAPFQSRPQAPEDLELRVGQGAGPGIPVLLGWKGFAIRAGLSQGTSEAEPVRR